MIWLSNVKVPVSYWTETSVSMLVPGWAGLILTRALGVAAAAFAPLVLRPESCDGEEQRPVRSRRQAEASPAWHHPGAWSAHTG
jgi:hypothetical protein